MTAVEVEPGDVAGVPTRSRGRELGLVAALHLEAHAVAGWGDALELLWTEPPGREEGAAWVDLLEDAAARAFARRLLTGLGAELSRVDAAIDAVSTRWRLRRMDAVDRAILRLGTFELLQHPSVPRGVIAAEWVGLASRYGSERSAGFVNGVLESVAERVRPTSVVPARPQRDGTGDDR